MKRVDQLAFVSEQITEKPHPPLRLLARPVFTSGLILRRDLQGECSSANVGGTDQVGQLAHNSEWITGKASLPVSLFKNRLFTAYLQSRRGSKRLSQSVSRLQPKHARSIGIIGKHNRREMGTPGQPFIETSVHFVPSCIGASDQRRLILPNATADEPRAAMPSEAWEGV